MTPKQAALIVSTIYGTHLSGMIKVSMEWDTFPWILVAGQEKQEHLDKVCEFLDELALQFRKYAETCPKKHIPYPRKHKETKETGPAQIVLGQEESP